MSNPVTSALAPGPLLPPGSPRVVGIVLNDIHGFGDPGLYPVLAASQCRLVVMHAVQPAGTATRVVTDPDTVWAGIRAFFTRRLASACLCWCRRLAKSPATLAAEVFAAFQGADYIRTHDVAATRDALTVLSAVSRESRALCAPSPRAPQEVARP